MRVEFLGDFSKDVSGIGLKSAKKKIIALISLVENVKRLQDIPNMKK